MKMTTIVGLNRFFFLDDLTGFEITYLLEVITSLPVSTLSDLYNYTMLLVFRSRVTIWSICLSALALMQLPEPFSFIFVWFAALPAILWISQAITKLIVKDFLILKVIVRINETYDIWIWLAYTSHVINTLLPYLLGHLSQLWYREPLLLWDYPFGFQWRHHEQFEMLKVRVKLLVKLMVVNLRNILLLV